ncbi:MAG: twin-arginine translocase TatA/TatE family subunit [Candidatus Dormibacteria bacterium]
MLGDHWIYIVILLLLALVVFGPKRLPELGHAAGRALSEFKRGTQSVGDEAKSFTTVVQSGLDGSAPAQPANAVEVAAPGSPDAAAGHSDSAG